MKQGPIRTCVMTREAHPAEELVRLVVDPDGVVEVDYRAKLPGRGAWILPTRVVIEAAEKKPGQIQRALEEPKARVDGLLERMRAANERAVLDMLSLAARSGCLHSGADAVRDALQDDTFAVLVASDASERSVADVTGRRTDLPVFPMPLGREELGRRIGKGPRAVVAVGRGAPARALIHELRRMMDLR